MIVWEKTLTTEAKHYNDSVQQYSFLWDTYQKNQAQAFGYVALNLFGESKTSGELWP